MGSEPEDIPGEMNHMTAMWWKLRGTGISLLFSAIVTGTSMEPSIRSGDLVIGITRGSLRRGDVIIFPDQKNEQLIVHRISSFKEEMITTRGDNNPYGMSEMVSSGRVLARVVLRVPGAGSGIIKLRKLAGGIYG
jgi:signal peptidase I